MTTKLDIQEIRVTKQDDGSVIAQADIKFPTLSAALMWAAGNEGQQAPLAPTAPVTASAPAARTRAAKPETPPASPPAGVVQTVVPPVQQTLPIAPPPAPAASAPPPAAVHAPPPPAAAPAGGAPAELVAATSFRHIMVWMIANGYKDKNAIIAKCEELRPSVPAIGRLPGDISDRVARALEVLMNQTEGAPAAS